MTVSLPVTKEGKKAKEVRIELGAVQDWFKFTLKTEQKEKYL